MGTPNVNKYDDNFEGCCDCIYDDIQSIKYPCCECKHNFMYNDPYYETAPSYYIPKYFEVEKEDIINHPNHYTNGGMECIDEMKLVFGKEFTANFCLGNVWKYRYRALTKNGQEDLDKANRYMAMYKEIVDSCRGEGDYE